MAPNPRLKEAAIASKDRAFGPSPTTPSSSPRNPASNNRYGQYSKETQPNAVNTGQGTRGNGVEYGKPERGLKGVVRYKPGETRA